MIGENSLNPNEAVRPRMREGQQAPGRTDDRAVPPGGSRPHSRAAAPRTLLSRARRAAGSGGRRGTPGVPARRQRPQDEERNGGQEQRPCHDCDPERRLLASRRRARHNVSEDFLQARGNECQVRTYLCAKEQRMRGKVDTRETVRRRFLSLETEFTNGRTLKAKSSCDVTPSMDG